MTRTSIRLQDPSPKGSSGFTLVELMVALALAAMISVAIMVISSQAQLCYEATSRKVDVYNKFRFVLVSIERDFAQWIPTSNLEFFMDGRGAGARRNENWDPGEELPDRSDAHGPGVIDGGTPKEFDEFAYILERHYIEIQADGITQKIHDAFQAYFRTMTFIDGRTREANIEYALLDPTTLDADGNPLPPTEVTADRISQLSLYKIVRYHDIGYGEIEKPSLNFPILRKFVEVCTNITDFRIEYTTDNRFDPRTGAGFKVPREDSMDGNPSERETAAMQVEGSLGWPGGAGYRKTFGYGSLKLQRKYERAIAYRSIFGDRQTRTDHRPVRFGWDQNPRIRFAELTPGDKIFVFTDSARGGSGGGIGVAGNLSSLTSFPSGLYTVKTNIGGRLEFYEDIDAMTWQRDQTGINYKAAFLPEAIRITIRVIDETLGKDARTLQRAVWIRRKAR